MDNLKDSNTFFSELTSDELSHFFEYLKNYQISYQDVLSIDEPITFGTEIEFEHIRSNTDIRFKECSSFEKVGWLTIEDISLKRGIEILSPILYNNKKVWEYLFNVCIWANKNGKIDKSSASHVHTGASYFGEDISIWLKFFKICRSYEHILYHFFYGEYFNHRPNIEDYAKLYSKKFNEIILDSDQSCFEKFYNSFYRAKSKYLGISLNNVNQNFDKIKQNTIEFRIPNGTLNPIIWQNNINTVLNLMNTSKNKNVDEEKLNYKYFMDISKYKLKNYYKIYVEDALDFADLIFDNDLDKINFLKQYFKNFKEKESYRKTDLTNIKSYTVKNK